MADQPVRGFLRGPPSHRNGDLVRPPFHLRQFPPAPFFQAFTDTPRGRSRVRRPRVTPCGVRALRAGVRRAWSHRGGRTRRTRPYAVLHGNAHREVEALPARASVPSSRTLRPESRSWATPGTATSAAARSGSRCSRASSVTPATRRSPADGRSCGPCRARRTGRSDAVGTRAGPSRTLHLFGTGWPKNKRRSKRGGEWWIARTGPSTDLGVEACRVGPRSTRPARSRVHRPSGPLGLGDGRRDGHNQPRALPSEPRADARAGLYVRGLQACDGATPGPRNNAARGRSALERCRGRARRTATATRTGPREVDAWTCVEAPCGRRRRARAARACRQARPPAALADRTGGTDRY